MHGGDGNDHFVLFDNLDFNGEPAEISDFSIANDRDVLDIILGDGRIIASITDDGTNTTITINDTASIILHGLTGGSVPLTSIADINAISHALFAHETLTVP